MSCRDERLVFGGLRLVLVIELVSKWEICWALWSLVVFDSNYDPTRNNIVTFFNGRFSEREKLYCRTLYFFPENSEIPATSWT